MTTVHHNRDFIGPMLRANKGKYAPVEDWLLEGANLVWREYLTESARQAGVRSITAPKPRMHKEQFLNYYKTYGRHILSMIVGEWLDLYGCEGAYKDFYSMKLREVAGLMARGERRTGELWSAIRSKPDVEVRFFYDSDAWESLGE